MPAPASSDAGWPVGRVLSEAGRDRASPADGGRGLGRREGGRRGQGERLSRPGAGASGADGACPRTWRRWRSARAGPGPTDLAFPSSSPVARDAVGRVGGVPSHSPTRVERTSGRTSRRQSMTAGVANVPRNSVAPSCLHQAGAASQAAGPSTHVSDALAHALPSGRETVAAASVMTRPSIGWSETYLTPNRASSRGIPRAGPNPPGCRPARGPW